MCRLSGDQSQHNILAWFPFNNRLGFIFKNVDISSKRSATFATKKEFNLVIKD